MGTTSFNGKFSGMRKEQSFIVYPISITETYIMIQSNTRFGYIEIATGVCTLSASHVGGAYCLSYAIDHAKNKCKVDVIPQEEFNTLLNFIRGTSNPMAGNNGMNVFCDNGKAHTI